IGLGIGLNTAIFSVVNGVLLAPLPYADADRIIYVRHPAVRAGIANGQFSFLEAQDLRAARSLDQVVEYGDFLFNVTGDQEPHRAVGGLVTSNYFEVLGLRPQVGRMLVAEDDSRDAEPVMVLTHDYWTRVYGADPSVVGRTVTLIQFGGPAVARIVGVLAPGTHYTGTRRQEFFVNYTANQHYSSATMENERAHRMTTVFARLRAGHTVEGAAAELDLLHRAMVERNPEAYPATMGFAITAARWQDELTAKARPTFLILMGTVALVLLLACANVANLTLSRLFRREREFAVRAALGAGRTRLRKLLLTENLVLSLAGAGLGLLLATWALGALVQYANRFTVRTGEIRVDVPVLLFTIAVSVSVALLLAWGPSLPGAPALGSTAGAASSARGVVGLARKHAQRLLVMSQLALSFILLIGAGLLVRSLINLARLDTGINYEDVVTMQAPSTGMPTQQNLQLLEQVVEQVRALPGVLSVAHASLAPWDPNVTLLSRGFRVEGGDEGGMPSPMSQTNWVSPLYFQTVGVNVVRGRTFQPSDDANAEPVAIISQRMALDLFGGEDPIGRRIAAQNFDDSWGDWRRVVGVAADTREYGLSLSGVHTLYRPAAQGPAGPSLLVRTASPAQPIYDRVREIVSGLDPNRPVDNLSTLAALRDNAMAPERLNATLFSAFALLALLIAGVGVFSVLAFTVGQRTQEFGVRMALGARPWQVLASVLREGVVMTGGALALGAVVAPSLSGFLTGFLFQVAPTDGATYAGVAALLASAALLAAYLPARRATRVDPMQALRSE
ncbi:MAG TPA: ABC transporter permease, partial [Gemmatimonadales bacterium]|nr:ABC transporter permease [Gemmatimonadales bacterium]